ncbi:hypothetical protein OHV10_21475 [Vibrio splendidus]|uniref:hypothetical protein n=1 Tax=Vibrio splendidus TaxID=29497 RepID=UPI0022365144|nr:hypothetical protein [Vibrio splendidus]MCW4446814.1 hypothetical protein [Vibrio splendidus]
MKSKLLGALVVSAALVGCGGGSGGGSSSTSTQPAGFESNGIYANDADLVVMIVDDTRAKNNVIVGDFAGDAVYFTHSAESSQDKMVTTGLTYADTNNYLVDSTLEMTSTFSGDTATITGTVNNQNVIYSLDKTASTKALSDIAGTHTNADDGSVWTIGTDGAFSLTGAVCQISGTLVRNGEYFDLTNAQAVSCIDDDLNGSYSGVLVTASHNGQSYMGGLMGNDDALLWGSVPIN